jgi:hypothetical protein
MTKLLVRPENPAWRKPRPTGLGAGDRRIGIMSWSLTFRGMATRGTPVSCWFLRGLLNATLESNLCITAR